MLSWIKSLILRGAPGPTRTGDLRFRKSRSASAHRTAFARTRANTGGYGLSADASRLIATGRRRKIGHRKGIGLAFLACACGSRPQAGPSPVAPPAATVAAPPFGGLDPAYVRTLAVVNMAGQPKRWEGGPMHHCFADDVDRPTLERVADRMATVSGIPRTEAGPCSVEWVVEAQGPDTKAISRLGGTETAIYGARVMFATGPASRSYATALHEGGHVLGLNHSPRTEDLMVAAGGTAADFTAGELAVLAWIYGI